MENVEKPSKLDAKDYEILREFDNNFRQSFSKIGKKVNLSKNSVALRFDKLKEYTLHNMLGLNYELLGLTTARIYYSFDFYNEETERLIIKEAGKYRNIQWIAKYYGYYDLGVGILVDNLDDLVYQINKFDEKFAGRISQKEIEIVIKQLNFLFCFLIHSSL